MSNDFDEFPINDPLIKNGSNKMSEVWITVMTTFYMNLIDYLSQFGIFVPRITTKQRNSIQSPTEGQMIYNTTLSAPQIFQTGVWKTFTTT
jgi:hypothetical protein